MEANKSKDNRWTVFIPGGDLCTDAQIIESTDDENSNSAASDSDKDTQQMEEYSSVPRPEGLKINGKCTKGGASWGLFGENWKQLSPNQISKPASQSETSEVLDEEDLHLYLTPSQPSAPPVEASTTETEDLSETAGSFTDSQEIPSDVSQRSQKADCHAPSCSSCGSISKTVTTQTSTPDICRKYTSGTCKYGIAGEKCKYSHPEACSALLKYGQWRSQGCSKGDECSLFHPMCRAALTKSFCTRGDSCRYQHPKAWQRIVGDVAKLSK